MLEDNDKFLNFFGAISKVFLLSEEGKKEEAKLFLKEYMDRSKLLPKDIIDNFVQFSFDEIHGVFFVLRYLPHVQEAMGMKTEDLESYLWN